MKLDYNPKTGAFFLRVPRSKANDLMRYDGLDLSLTAGSDREAVLFTHEPYAAVNFYEGASPEAKAQLENLHHEIASSWASDSGAHIRVPMDKELWPFQRASVEYALKRTNALVGDQPGLGKTPIAVAYANEIGARRILCIVPASIRLQWAKVIRDWTTMRWPFYTHVILNGRSGVHPSAQWTVVSYELARTEAIGKALARGHYDLLVLDEAHYLKTVDARRTRAVFGGGTDRSFDALASRSDRVLALTGTPLPNRPREAYTLARGLCWDSIDWMSEERFKQRFNPSRRGETPEGKVYIDERSGRHSELQARLRANFMVRHLKRDVMTQLKLPVYDLIQLEETGAVKEALAAEAMLDIDPENLEGADATVLGHISVVRRLMGIALAPQIAEYVDMILDGGEEKLVLFAWHIAVLDILEERLMKHGVVRVDGSTSTVKKQCLVKKFQTDPKCQVIIGNLLSLGTGTDGLQEVSTHALIAEPDWTPGNNQQAADRLDRGGQKGQVQVDIFVAPGSIAEKVLASALRKLQTTHKALDKKGN